MGVHLITSEENVLGNFGNFGNFQPNITMCTQQRGLKNATSCWLVFDYSGENILSSPTKEVFS